MVAAAAATILIPSHSAQLRLAERIPGFSPARVSRDVIGLADVRFFHETYTQYFITLN